MDLQQKKIAQERVKKSL